ncbi:MAG: GNAT family N-acetyltransferase [Candidatus Heimdallarchaeota archaeon]|nr:GNAT family N-acetyltransferase [Candidatus Heimdallarchaeota archaeon]
MTQDVKIRQMTIDDIINVYKLGKQAFIDEKKADKSYVYSYWSLMAVAHITQENIELAYVAETNGRLIGFALGHPQYEHISDVGYLEWLAVSKEFRRKGIATQLVNHLLAAYKEKGVPKVVTDVKGTNEESSTLFQEKLGFKLKESVNFLELTFKSAKKRTRKK